MSCNYVAHFYFVLIRLQGACETCGERSEQQRTSLYPQSHTVSSLNTKKVEPLSVEETDYWIFYSRYTTDIVYYNYSILHVCQNF